VLIADLPPEAAETEVLDVARAHGVALIFIVSPLTSTARLQKICAMAGGFVYVVSRLGITGVEERYDESLQRLLAEIKANTTLPACVGFGISTPEQARQMITLGADGVITGSAIIQQVQRDPEGLRDYIRQMVRLING
jgi:tryptophan synthase alpha chain